MSRIDSTERPASVVLEAMRRRERARQDPSQEIPGMPPNYGDHVLPHVTTFQAIISSAARVYRASDEALRDSAANARFMRNDPMLMECVEQRQRSTSLLGWHLEPDDANDRTQKWLAEELTAILEQTPRWMQYRENLLHALWYGKYGVSNVFRWKRVRGNQRLVVAAWRPVNGDKIVFRWDSENQTEREDQVGIRVGAGITSGTLIANRWPVQQISQIEATDVGLAYFLEPWERNLLAIHKHMIEDGEYEDPLSAGRIHGVGIRSRLYWTWYQKQETLAWLMEYLERSAFGIEIWYYPWGNEHAEQMVRKAATERIGQGRNIITVPRPLGEEGMAYGVERIEPGMAGVEACQKLVTEYFGHQAKRYILGQTLTSEAASTGLGSNLADIHLASYLQIIKYDAINLEETITKELVEPLKTFNFPRYADIPIRFKIDTEAADVESKLQAWRQAWEMGVKLKAQEVMDLIGASKPLEGDETLENPELAQARAQQQAAQQPQGRSQAAMPGESPEAQQLWRNLQVEQLKKILGEKGMLGGDGAGQPGTEQYDRLPGGRGDGASPSQFDRWQVQAGVRAEMEHTADPGIALEIALDHLAEDPNYYGRGEPNSEASERKRIVESYSRGHQEGPLRPFSEPYKRRDAAGQKSFDWDPEDHPRDDEGKFTEKGQTDAVDTSDFEAPKSSERPPEPGPKTSHEASGEEQSLYHDYVVAMQAAKIAPRPLEKWLENYREAQKRQPPKAPETAQPNDSRKIAKEARRQASAEDRARTEDMRRAGTQDSVYLANSVRRGSKAKEPHQMTLEEWADHYGAPVADVLQRGESRNETANEAYREHADWIAKAKRFGRTIPDAVLTQYGDRTTRQAQQEEKTIARRQRSAAKLLEIADRVEGTASEDLSRDRKTNTRRRADMAEHAIAGALSQVALANSLRNIADAITSGQAEHLAEISSKAQVETLDSLLSTAKSRRSTARNERYDEYRYRPAEADDVEHARFPWPSVHKDNLKNAAQALRKHRGSLRLANRMLGHVMALGDGDRWQVQFRTPEDIKQFEEFISACKEHYISEARWMTDGLGTYKRLVAAGIDSEQKLKQALREYLLLKGREGREDPAKKLERELVGRKIPGFFPTPRAVVDRMLDEAKIKKGHRVLEPSAGKGDILDAVKIQEPGADLRGIEVSGDLQKILQAKGHKIEHGDFLEHQGQYDRIVMNPPFENGQDIDHVCHAYRLLAPEGRVVAIMSSGPFFREDSKSRDFRAWLDQVGGWSEPLPEGSFKSGFRPTGVNTRLVVIDRDASAANREHYRQPWKRRFSAEDEDRIQTHLQDGRGELFVEDEAGSLYGYAVGSGAASVACYGRPDSR
jgi:phage gp29-like protein